MLNEVETEYDKEFDANGNSIDQTNIMVETGVKFRFNVGHTPLGLLKKVTDFWGVRAGIRYIDYKSIDPLSFVVEIGAGSF